MRWQPGWFGGPGVTSPNIYDDLACNDDATQVKVAGGKLQITAQRQRVSCDTRAEHGDHQDLGMKVHHYVSGLISSSPRALGRKPGYNAGFQFTYGVAEFRARIPADSAGQCANWPTLWTSGYPEPVAGEIDAFECLDSASEWNLHTGDGDGADPPVGGTPGGHPWTGWHTFAVDWEPGTATLYYDGHLVGRHRYAVTTPNYLVISNGVRYGSRIVTPTTLDVDWVRVFQRSTSPTAQKLTVSSAGIQLAGATSS